MLSTQWPVVDFQKVLVGSLQITVQLTCNHQLHGLLIDISLHCVEFSLSGLLIHKYWLLSLLSSTPLTEIK